MKLIDNFSMARHTCEVNFFPCCATDKLFLFFKSRDKMILMAALFCALQFQTDEPANGRFKLINCSIYTTIRCLRQLQSRLV